MHVSLSVPSPDIPAAEPAPRPVDPGAYRLVRRRPPAGGAGLPTVDAHQRRVVEHPGGPLLVLAGPGTGKTTTLVEAVAARVHRGTDPERILVLTFSRKAAVDLRDRMTERLAERAPRATTFHSFSYALLRGHSDRSLFAEPPRLLSGPEQDLYLRELLAGQPELARAGRGIDWPPDLRACLTTRGLADELRAVLARTRELGLDPGTLGGFAHRTGRPDWYAAARFIAEYLDVTEQQGVIDYTELVHRAVRLAEGSGDPAGTAAAAAAAATAGTAETARRIRESYDAVYVDEYQDTDPAQVRLLRALAGEGRDLTVFGDPDQSVYAFRGADVNGILGFRDTFRTRDGRPAPVAVLRTCRRSAAELLSATRLITRRMPLPRLPADTVRAHRALEPTRPGGSVRALTFPTPGAELDNIADLLRRAHLEDGIPWGEMAVLVRAGHRTLPSVRRALTVAGVPVHTDGDDVPLRHEPAVAPLLTALRAVARPEGPATDTAVALLTSPLGGMDATDLRRLGRALRAEERAAGHTHPAPWDELVTRALAEPERLIAHDPAYAAGAQKLGQLLRKARERLAGGASAEDVLWELWDGTDWPHRLARAAHRGGPAGRNADRDLDAICDLFDAAARAEERGHGRGALNFLAELESHDIAADTRTPRPVRPDSVQLMTAHRSKGLQWRLVVVAGVQEGLWPDLRRRGSLLEADRIGRDGLAPPMSSAALLAEERRLFYVAATRARERLIVTAVRGGDDGDQPSRFLTELGAEPEDITGRPRRPLAVPALVAELRATTVDPQASPALRRAAARRLAKLAALRDEDGGPMVPGAHPQRWWGLREPTRGPVPVRDPERPVALTGSALEQLTQVCSLRWFLGREVHAEGPPGTAQTFGNVLHVLADEVASGATPADLEVLQSRLDGVWDSLVFEAPWQSRQEREDARAALERFLAWHVQHRDAGRLPVASEEGFDITLPAGQVEVRIRGTWDRIDRDTEGRVYVVDFKTARTPATGPEAVRHPQLAVYQLAVAATADATADSADRLGGAELVYLRAGAAQRDGGDTRPAVRRQPPLEGEGEARIREVLAEAAGRVLDERFAPRTGDHCGHCSFRTACSGHPEGRQTVE
ncbi:ATP-dependent helicase [Streptomyces aidingensis]|uniref:DNA 3'-5' helicase n=1 Tax=Streptomyces aidingensis TaxID=910347 RepID=A0A1I1EX64_9ACTN|nr:ATP-dependent DNA helicase [Streptomyces aidingensis]SFB91735.1 Superfamily I DNA or RNA helicase [Streptomyces aidingensis]